MCLRVVPRSACNFRFWREKCPERSQPQLDLAGSDRAVSQKRPVLTRFIEFARPASSGSAAVSHCISKPMSHKVVGFLGFETHAQMKLIFPVNIWQARPFRATLLQALRRACHIHRKHLPYILRVLCSRNVKKVAHSSILRKFHIVWQQLCMLIGQSTGNICHIISIY